MKRCLPWIVMLATLVVAGCRLDIVVDVNMASDGSGVVTVTARADAELSKAQPGIADDLALQDAKDNGWKVEDPAVAEDGSTTLKLTHKFADKAELANVLSSIGPPLSAPVGTARTSDGRQVVNGLQASLVLPNGYASFADSDLVAAAGGIPFASKLNASGVPPQQGLSFTLDVRLPGRLLNTPTGTTLDNGTIRWKAPMDGTQVPVEVQTVQQIGGGNNWWALPLSWISLGLLIAWSIFAFGFIVYVIYSRRQRAKNRQMAVRNLSETRSPNRRSRRR